jgi:EamA domain-containing membrane protein RarD
MYLALLGVLLSVLCIGIQPNLQKWLMNRANFTPFETLVVRCGGTSLCAAIALAAFTSYWQRLNASHANPTLFYIALASTTVANIGVYYFELNAQKIAQVSFLAPLRGMTPGLVTFGGLLFGELPGRLGWAGIILIAAATFVHAREGCALKEYLTPFYVWRAVGPLDRFPQEERNKRLALRYAYLGSLFATVGLTADGLMARSGNPVVGLSLQFGVLALIFFGWQLVRTKKGTIGEFIRKASSNGSGSRLMALAIFSGLSPVFLCSAYGYLPVAYVGALKRLSIVVGILIALFIFKELAGSQKRSLRYRRLAMSMVIMIGAILITIDPTKAHFNGGLVGMLTQH